MNFPSFPLNGFLWDVDVFGNVRGARLVSSNKSDGVRGSEQLCIVEEYCVFLRGENKERIQIFIRLHNN